MTDTSTIDTSAAAVERLASEIERRYRYPGAIVYESGPEGIRATLRALAAERDQMWIDLNEALLDLKEVTADRDELVSRFFPGI